MGYSIAAWDEFGAEDFCQYMYDQEFLNKLEKIGDEITIIADELQTSSNIEEVKLALPLRAMVVNLSTIDLNYAKWNTAYTGLLAYPETSDTTVEELKGEMGDVINSYAMIFYGKNVIDEI